LQQIERSFPALLKEGEITLRVVDDDISGYPGYSLLHSWAGAIHMALSQNGKFHRNDFVVQAEEVASLSAFSPPGIVCELGCGSGFNVAVVANREPGHAVVGIDLNNKHIGAARKNMATLPTCSFSWTIFMICGASAATALPCFLLSRASVTQRI
jgi:methylase of polypeptide subunit release factors